MPPAKKTSSAQNTTLQSMGMDVIKQYPGPLTVSRAVKVDVPGKHFPQLTGAEQNASYAHREGDHRALHAEVRQRYIGCTVLHLAGPIELRRCRFGCAILVLGRPVNLRPRRRPTLRRPARWRRLQRAGVLQNTPYDA